MKFFGVWTSKIIQILTFSYGEILNKLFLVQIQKDWWSFSQSAAPPGFSVCMPSITQILRCTPSFPRWTFPWAFRFSYFTQVGIHGYVLFICSTSHGIKRLYFRFTRGSNGNFKRFVTLPQLKVHDAWVGHMRPSKSFSKKNYILWV